MSWALELRSWRAYADTSLISIELGAPVHRQLPLDYNPMFPMMGSQDGVALASREVASNGVENGNAPVAAVEEDDRTPPANGQPSASSASAEPSYFPPVFASTSAGSTPSTSSTPSPAISAPSSIKGGSAPLSPAITSAASAALRPELPPHSHSADSATATTKSLAGLKLDAASASGAGWATDFGFGSTSGGGAAAAASSEGSAGAGENPAVMRRKSFVPGAGSSLEIRRRFEQGEEGGAAGVGAVGSQGVAESLMARRASLEEGTSRKPRFGSSIWGM